MNKQQKFHQSILPGHSNGAAVVQGDVGFAIRMWKKKVKDSDILTKVKDNREFVKPSVTQRIAKNKAKFIQQIRSREI